MGNFWNYWNSLSQGLREAIVAGIISTVAGAFILGALKLSGFSIRALFRRGSQPLPQAPNSALPHVIVNVPPATIMPHIEQVPANEQVSLQPLIPKSPAVGFVARRDTDGRDIVELLKRDLSPERNALLALWGEGGIGKTTLAGETVRALSETYNRRILWTSADKRADFTYSTFLDEIALRLNRNDVQRFAVEPKATEVLQMLSAAPTLVVLDNFETISPDEATCCVEFLANKTTCSALITSRQRVAGARNLRIDAMSHNEATEFLDRLIRQSAHPPAFVNLNRQRLMETAGLNPLVMEWIVAQIGLAQRPGDVLEELAQGRGDAAQRVFDRSFNLPQLGDDGRSVLLALSLFIPSASREALAAVTGFANEKERLNEIVKRLAALRLLSAVDGGDRLLVQGLTRELAKVRLEKN